MDARMYTCKRRLYTISYRVHVYKITLMSVLVSVLVPWNSSFLTFTFQDCVLTSSLICVCLVIMYSSCINCRSCLFMLTISVCND